MKDRIKYLLIIFYLISPLIAFSDVVMHDFENGAITKYDSEWEQYSYFDEYGEQTVQISTPGLLDSYYCMDSYAADSSEYSNSNWIENPFDQGYCVQEANNTDRFSFYAIFPSDLVPTDDSNFHIGTYCNDCIDGNNGYHWYHLFRLYGSTYPLHLVANEHPQNHNLNQSEVPLQPYETDYNGGDYWSHLTRFYIQLIEEDYTSRPFHIYYDDFEFYAVSESENDETVNSIWVGYMGSNDWRMGFALNCQHTISCAAKNHDFQVRYSTSEITNANFSSATLAGTFNYASSTYNQVPVSFNIAGTDISGDTHYYFAVDDMDDGSSYVTKIDYVFTDDDGASTPTDGTPKSSESGCFISSINVHN